MVLTFVCYSAGRYKVEYFLCIIAVLFTLNFLYFFYIVATKHRVHVHSFLIVIKYFQYF